MPKMFGMRPKGSQQTLEWRRHRAIELLDDGKSPAEVADFLGVSRNTVYRWRRRYRRDGRDGIEAKPIPGRPPRLAFEAVDHAALFPAEPSVDLAPRVDHQRIEGLV